MTIHPRHRAPGPDRPRHPEPPRAPQRLRRRAHRRAHRGAALDGGRGRACASSCSRRAGASFSAGADLNWMKRMAGFSKDENQRDAMALGALMRTLDHLRKPTIARVHGAAFGGGVGLVACCDIAVATQRRAVRALRGEAGAHSRGDLAVRGRRDRRARRAPLLPHRRALRRRRGLAPGPRARAAPTTRTTLDDEDRRDRRRAAALRPGGAARGQGADPRRRRTGRCTSELLQDTAERIARVRASPEGREGVAAFLEKRKAAWVPPDPEVVSDDPSPGAD